MRRISLGVAVALITFAVGGSMAGVWKYVTRKPIDLNCDWSHTASPHARNENSIAMEEISKLYDGYAVAQTNHDAGFFEKVEADTFVLTYVSGDTLTRDQAIAAMNKWDKDIQYSSKILDIQLYGGTAFVKMEMEATYPDTGFSHDWRWVDVLKKRNGDWQILSSTQIN